MSSDKPSLDDAFAAEARRRKSLRESLHKSAIQEIIGVVNASAVSGSKARGETLWRLNFTFEAWRFPGREVRKTPLAIFKKVSDGDLKALQKAVAAYDVLRLRVHIRAEGDTDALLAEIVGADADAELNAISKQLQEPVTFADSQFGIFLLDRRGASFDTQTTWNAKPVTLTLCGEHDLDVQAALATARALWNTQADWDRRVCAYAADDLLEIKNDTWLQEDEAEISREAFIETMRLDVISVAADGHFDFWFDDGDLFWGHSICVSGDLVQGPTRADIAG